MQVRRFEMKNRVGVLVCILLLLLLWSCGEPESPITIDSAEELAGVWHRTTRTGFGEVYRQYTEDGFYRMGSSLEELEAQPWVEGRFWFEGYQIVVQDTAGIPGYDICVEGETTGRYDLEVLGNGHIRFVLVEDECAERAGLVGAGEMERVK
jgi:hypothetical protein